MIAYIPNRWIETNRKKILSGYNYIMAKHSFRKLHCFLLAVDILHLILLGITQVGIPPHGRERVYDSSAVLLFTSQNCCAM